MIRVLCWDIDGTLLSTGRAGIFAFEDAVREVLGVSVDLMDFPTAGLTDVDISQKLVAAYGDGATDPATAQRLLRCYEAGLPASLPRKQGKVMPNVPEVLAAATRRPDLVNILLTGNTRAGAHAKLTHYGLAGFFQHGAFAEDAPDRTSVAYAALAIACDLAGAGLDPTEIAVIGDTPHDVACGKAIGACTVVVATGGHPLPDLLAYEPWQGWEQLPEPLEFFRRLGIPEWEPAR